MRRGGGVAGKRGRRLLTISLLLTTITGVGTAQDASRRPPTPASPPESLTVYLMTMGPGRRVWERFGHNAIWIHDPAAGTDKAYNYGLFDLRQDNFVLRFIQGRMWYWMQGFPAQSYVDLYRRANRSVWIQELDIPPASRRELQRFLEWNERPENRFYHYDYYRDNCSTRIRDALDRAIGGRIQESTGQRPTGKTYRFHTRRLTAADPLVYTGLLLALGQPVDRPISAWEEMFLPLALREHIRDITLVQNGVEKPLVKSERTLFESSDPAPPDRPPFLLPYYLITGLVIGGAAFGAGRASKGNRAARLGLVVGSAVWALVVGIAGLVVAGLWAFTDHAAAYRNENLLQASFVVLLLPWWVRKGRGVTVALVVAALAALGLFLKLFPPFFQVNGEIIALALPAHLGVAAGLMQMTRR
ncbi:MAG TPA: DUF4105 domain-containing protein [Gemmatimonadales bacterium]|nr:DUF4105 domain-containing protein [Gemmatimonadales bacterium]